MSFELFEEETRIIEENRGLLQSDMLPESAIVPFAALLGHYERLLKDAKRLMRVSDRNEQTLQKTTQSLDEKNSTLERLSQQLSKYLSPQVYASIFSGKRAMTLTTERKKLTVFFSDIKDFTATTDDLEPEDITFLINDYLTHMSRIALEYGATIDKYIGDAMLIFFGDPETRGVREDALACVRMAIAMQRQMMNLRAKWTEMGYARPFQMRVGINTGFCNVGNFGSEERMDYTIIGGEVNLAARLEGVADPDGITLSHETYALVKEHIDAQQGDSITVKGIHRKITPYKLTGIYKDADEKNRFLRAESEGMRLFLDLDKLDEGSRALAIREMEAALARLRHESRIQDGEPLPVGGHVS
ncbi:MAG: adenylate/guanylate cyclase domain-containing protein [Magnetococcales bacterium]|nr:adenylate/guanylate cyclase domain-containing protein [Magnetococcales bacterium]